MSIIKLVIDLSEYSGHRNLEVASEGHNFNNWIYEQIFPALQGSILEVGSGIGTFSEKIIKNFPNSKITLTDISTFYVEKLHKKFHGENVSIFKLDLNQKEDYEKIGYEKFDSIVAINVLEHVENDIIALQQLYKMLKKDGKLVILVPCHKFLYNVIDSSIGHYRRYTKKELVSKINKTEFNIIHVFSFNMLGIVGWYLNGNLGKTAKVNGAAFRIYDRIVPFLRLVERVLQKKLGLSIICYLQK